MLDERTVERQMAALDHAVKLPKLELGKVGRFDLDWTVVRRNDLESVAMIEKEQRAVARAQSGRISQGNVGL